MVTREGSLGSDIEAMLKEEDGHTAFRGGVLHAEKLVCAKALRDAEAHMEKEGGSVSAAEGALSKNSRAKLFQ